MASITSSQAAAPRIDFPSLPIELRLMIWRATFEPRILHITSKITVLPGPIRILPDPPHGYPATHVRFKAREPPPIALQICRESRALALKHYIPSFHPSTFPSDCAREMTHTAVYFCPELDTVYIANNLGGELYLLTHRTDQETIRRIRALAIRGWRSSIATSLLPFENLETLILVYPGTEKVGEQEASLIREQAEVLLGKVQNDRLVLQENCRERRLPAVKVMNAQALENPL